jgi:prolyl-tRNA editing enzyme YbaK/EbsC (Cys-tRNA(Pro) deacylase)|tara:strand:+ start:315 stop:530 length:216 start_codon:yes stop_codon:yes gene_type:complete
MSATKMLGFSIVAIPPLGHAKRSIILLAWIFNGFLRIWRTVGTAETRFKLTPYQLTDLNHFDGCNIKTVEI